MTGRSAMNCGLRIADLRSVPRLKLLLQIQSAIRNPQSAIRNSPNSELPRSSVLVLVFFTSLYVGLQISSQARIELS